MKYFYIKLGKGNSLAKYMLQLDSKINLFNKSIVAIFYYDVTAQEYSRVESIEDLNELKQKHKLIPKKKFRTLAEINNQIKPFINAGKIRNNVIFVNVHKGRVFLLEPLSEVKDLKEGNHKKFNADLDAMIEDIKHKYKNLDDIKKSLLKYMFVKKKEIKNAPYILRTLNINQSFNQWTFREIDEENYWGIIQAIKKGKEAAFFPNKITPSRLFMLLSPHQFETLVFIILYNAELYSPAWRAGSLPDIDIEGINYNNSKEILLGIKPSIRFKYGIPITFQVKRKIITEKIMKEMKNDHKLISDYIIALDSDLKPKLNNKITILTAPWLLDVIKKQPKTKMWLENSLKWYIKGTKYNSIYELIVKEKKIKK